MSNITKPMLLDETGKEIIDALYDINVTLGGSSNVKIVTWADGSDAEIAAMLDAHYKGALNIYDYWVVGDERTIHLSNMSSSDNMSDSHGEQDVTFVLMHAGGKLLLNDTECAFIVGQKDCLHRTGYAGEMGEMQKTYNPEEEDIGGWDGCDRRSWCNSTYRNAFPETIVSIFKRFQNVTADGCNSPDTTTSMDFFALPSEKEVLGINTHSNVTAEADLFQFDYYKTSTHRSKSGESTSYWVRSPWSDEQGVYGAFSGITDGAVSGFMADVRVGISPFGVI